MAIGHEDGCAYGLGKKCDCKGVPPVAPTPPDSRPTRPDPDEFDLDLKVLGALTLVWAEREDKREALRKARAEIRGEHGCELTKAGEGAPCWAHVRTEHTPEGWCQGCKLAAPVSVDYWKAARRAGATLGVMRRMAKKINSRAAAPEERKDP